MFKSITLVLMVHSTMQIVNGGNRSICPFVQLQLCNTLILLDTWLEGQYEFIHNMIIELKVYIQCLMHRPKPTKIACELDYDDKVHRKNKCEITFCKLNLFLKDFLLSDKVMNAIIIFYWDRVIFALIIFFFNYKMYE